MSIPVGIFFKVADQAEAEEGVLNNLIMTPLSTAYAIAAQSGGGGGGSGDMLKATYDPANIGQQLVGLTATQTLTNKTLTAPNIGAATATSINFGGSALSNYIAAGTWTPAPTGLTVVGTPTYTGKYTRIGNIVFCSLNISSTTSTASTTGATYFTGLPVTPAFDAATVTAFNEGTGVAFNGTGGVYSGTQRVYTPTWSASLNVQVNFWYLV